MICPKCGQETDQDQELCPSCGAALKPGEKEPEEQTLTEQTVIESIAEEPAEETAEAITEESAEDFSEAQNETAEAVEETEEVSASTTEEGIADPAPQENPPERKKKSPLGIVAGVIIVLLAVIIVCLCAALNYVSKGGSLKDMLGVTEEQEEENIDGTAVALTLQNDSGETIAEITNEQLSFYFWGEYFYYVNNYGFSFDASLPLDEQTYQEETDDSTGETVVTTWEDYFMESAKTSIVQTVALKQAAEAEGFTMPEDYQSEYNSVIEAMTTNAASAGFTDADGNGDVLAYIQDSYGSNATVEEFEAYLYDSYYVSAYSDSVYNGFTYDDAQVEEYYDDNAEELQSYGIEKSDLPNVNVRHILIEPESTDEEAADEDSSTVEDSASEEASEEAAWAAAEEKAQEILAEWEAGEATEDSFAELAETYSADTGSNTNGGLYEDVYPGQMVTEFNDWCFDADRQAGDTAIVKTSYGYHIMYFVSFTDEYYYKTVAEQELRYSDYRAYVQDLVAAYTAEETENAAVGEPNAVKEIQQSAAAEDTAAG